jgi:hypothetical protein
MKKQTLVVCLAVFLGGCGSAGSSSTANNVTMQGGQWEYVTVPENSTIPMYIEANLPSTNVAFSVGNIRFFQPSEIDLPNATAPIFCDNLSMNATIGGTTLSGKFSAPPSNFANFSGELVANGQSISSGTYSGGTCSEAPPAPFNGPQVRAKFTGSTIAPVNGTFTGTLNSNLHGPDVVTLTITQNPDFSLNFSGTSVENGVTSDLIPFTGQENTLVIGAIVYLGGSAININGSNSFSFTAHLNTNATQMTITSMYFGPETPGSESLTGTLTKQ